jgi:hypothetical protein
VFGYCFPEKWLLLFGDYFTRETPCIFSVTLRDRMARVKKTLNPPFKPTSKPANASGDYPQGKITNKATAEGVNKTTEEIKKERRQQAIKEALELGMKRRQQAINKEIDLAVAVMAMDKV